jgi:hypothetical protein
MQVASVPFWDLTARRQNTPVLGKMIDYCSRVVIIAVLFPPRVMGAASSQVEHLA